MSGFKQQTATVKIARPHNESRHQNTPADMYSSTFIFATKQLDDEFHRLDQAIAEAARSIPGLDGYQVVISQVMKIYGDSRLGALPVSRIADQAYMKADLREKPSP